MIKRIAGLGLVAVFLFSLSGCATRRQRDLEMQGLRNQVSVLEAQLQSKDEEINSLKESLNSASQASIVTAPAKRIAEVKSRPNVKQIQIALRNAGYNPGSIDGKMGRQTKDAIKAFQKANGLKADGTVGKKTWELLGKYLYQKIK